MSEESTVWDIRSADDLPNTELLGKRPAIILGCDTKEISMICVFSFCLSLLLGIFASLLFGVTFFLLFFFTSLLIFIVTFLLILRGEKRQKPYGFYMQKVAIWLSKLSPVSTFVKEHKGWKTTRRRQNFKH